MNPKPFFFLFFALLIPACFAQTIDLNFSNGQLLISGDGTTITTDFNITTIAGEFSLNGVLSSQYLMNISLPVPTIANTTKFAPTFVNPNSVFQITSIKLIFSCPTSFVNNFSDNNFSCGNLDLNYTDLAQGFDENKYLSGNKIVVQLNNLSAGALSLDPTVAFIPAGSSNVIHNLVQWADQNIAFAADDTNTVRFVYSTNNGQSFSNIILAMDANRASIWTDKNMLLVTYRNNDGYSHFRFCATKSVDCTVLANWSSDVNFGRTDNNALTPASTSSWPAYVDFNSGNYIHMVVATTQTVGGALNQFRHYTIPYLDLNIANKNNWTAIGNVFLSAPSLLDGGTFDFLIVDKNAYFNYIDKNEDDTQNSRLAYWNISTNTWDRNIFVHGNVTSIGIDSNNGNFVKLFSAGKSNFTPSDKNFSFRTFFGGKMTNASRKYVSGTYDFGSIVPLHDPFLQNTVFFSSSNANTDINYFYFWDANETISAIIDFNTGGDNDFSPRTQRKTFTDFNRGHVIYLDNTNSNRAIYNFFSFPSTATTTFVKPNGNNYLSLVNGNFDGNQSIDFNFLTNTTNNWRIIVYLSSTKGAQQNQLFDYNLTGIAVNPNSDQNCGSSSNDFSSTRVCHLDWNLSQLYLGDGNYFVDLKLTNYDNALVSTASSNTAFVIDTNKPTVSWDGNNATWQTTDANVRLTCSDSRGCVSTSIVFKKDSDATSTSVLPTGVFYDSNILFLVAAGDGNFVLDFNATDLAGNISDLNSQVVLLDNTTPVISTQSPSPNQSTGSTNFNFEILVSDGNGSYGNTCDYNSFFNNTQILQNQTGTLNAAGSLCTISFTFNANDGQLIDVNVRIRDVVGLSPAILKSNSFLFTQASPGPSGDTGGGGGGGGGTTEITIISSENLSLIGSTRVISLFEQEPKSFFVTATSLVDENISVELVIPEDVKPFFTTDVFFDSIPPKETRIYRFTVKNPTDMNFSEIETKIGFKTGLLVAEVPLTIKQQFQSDFFSFLGGQILGIPAYIVVILVILLYILYTSGFFK